MSEPSSVVFLFDVDNTLLDNDRVSADLRRYLFSEVGAARADQYFSIFEELRAELGYSDDEIDDLHTSGAVGKRENR